MVRTGSWNLFLEADVEDNGSFLATIIKWAIIIVIAAVALKLVLGLLGIVLGFAAFLLFTVAPIVLLGWLIMKAWQAFTKAPA
jgi:hypothetical protein